MTSPRTSTTAILKRIVYQPAIASVVEIDRPFVRPRVRTAFENVSIDYRTIAEYVDCVRAAGYYAVSHSTIRRVDIDALNRLRTTVDGTTVYEYPVALSTRDGRYRTIDGPGGRRVRSCNHDVIG